MSRSEGPLLIVATHPTQFLAPWARHLCDRFNTDSGSRDPSGLMVWYVTLPDTRLQGCGFGRSFSWDIDLLSGYQWQQLGNRSTRPSLDRFFGTRVGGLINRLKALEPSAVLITGWHQISLLQVAAACRWLGIPVMIRAEASALKPRSWANRAFHRMLMRLFDGFLYIGAANQRYYLDRNVPSERMFFSPYFVDNERLVEASLQRETLRREWRIRHRIGPNRRIILFVGKLQQKKQPNHLLEALSILAAGDTNRWLVVFAGDGECRPDLERAARDSGLPVLFCGFVNQTGLPGVYAAADCLVLPSDFEETWGLVVNEAMNFGLPVLVSDQVGSGMDLVANGETGYVFPFGEPARLAESLRRVFSDDSHREALGKNARQLVAKYSIDAASDGLVAGWRTTSARVSAS